MRRIHLFEIEDLKGCPTWIRRTITDMLMVIHRWFGTAEILAGQLKLMRNHQPHSRIIDLCSGSGGPMPEAVRLVRESPDSTDVSLTLTDRYPNRQAIATIQQSPEQDLAWLAYYPDPVPATDIRSVSTEAGAIRTMICCLHHMSVTDARAILADAQQSGDPILIFEMTDNRFPPKWFWWIALVPNFLFGLVVAAFVRPLTIRHVFFSYMIPVIPACFAWDGAVSNIRTYAGADFEALIEPYRSPDYQWTTNVHQGRMMKHLIITGQPR